MKLWYEAATTDWKEGLPIGTGRLAAMALGRPGGERLACGEANDFLKQHRDLARFTFLPVPVEDIFPIPAGRIIHPHTDLWMHGDSTYRKQARAWLAEAIRENGQQSPAGDALKAGHD